jgi:AcrR family transcriptional regulator
MCAVTRRDPEIRNKIIAVSRALMSAQGVDHTSLAEIARTVGISKGTLFYYYTSKSDLVFDVTDQYFEQTTRVLTEWVNQVRGELSAREIISHVFHTIVEDELRSRLHHYLIEQAITEDSNLKARFLENYREWIELVSTGLSRIFPAAAGQETLAFLITASLDGMILQALLGNQEIPIEAVVTFLVNCALSNQSRAS